MPHKNVVFLEPELQPIQQHIEVLRFLARRTGLLQPIHGNIDLVLNPVVEIPVESSGELVGVVVEGGHKPRRKLVRLVNARFLGLYPVVAERDFPSSPAVSSRRSLGTKEWVLHFGRPVFRTSLTGQQISGLYVASLCDNPRKICEPQRIGLLRAHPAPELVELIVFSTDTPRAVGPGEFAVIALDRTVDPERRGEIIGGLGYGATEARLIGKAPAAAAADRSPEGESLKQIIFLLFPGIEAKPPNYFRLVGGVIGQDSLAVECCHPVLHHSTVKITADLGARAAVRCRGGRVQKRRQRPFHKVDIGDTLQEFLGERLFELTSLELESGIRLDVEVEVTKGNPVGGSGVDQKRKVVV